MAQIRAELHQDVQGVMKGAEATTDWRRYVRNYPWVMTGVAFGVGFLLAPRRRRSTTAAVVAAAPAIAAAAPNLAAAIAPAAEPAKKKGTGVFKTVVGLATPFALRAAQGYALQFFEQYLAQKMASTQSPFANLASQFLPEGMGGPGGPSAGGSPGPGGQPGPGRPGFPGQPPRG